MAQKRKQKRHPARSKPSAAKKRSLAAKKAWETRRAKAKARSQAAIKGWATRRKRKRILVDNELRREVWKREKKRALSIDEFVDAIVDDYNVNEHDAYSLYYSPELAA